MTQSSASYVSTRGRAPQVDFVEALLRGVAPDGGLYAPVTWPELSTEAMASGDAATTARAVLAPFVGDAIAPADLDRATRRLTQVFDHPATTPLVELEPGLFLLELFHGPTAAFKDYAMQMAAILADAALAAGNQRLRLVTATSGDTGAAAVRAFAGAERVDLVVLHPLDRVSPVQRRQMTTSGAANVLNLAVRGDFDDCQRLTKLLLADESLREGRRFSSVNSINWARLAGQIPYYVTTARALGAAAAQARYVVPTGNFGDAFAGWAARRMGLPMGGLVAATNRNDALVRALETGVYTRSAAVGTASVSMDVNAPSNFERLVYEASGRDADLTRGLFAEFARDGRATLPADLHTALRREVSAVAVDEATTRAEIAHAHAAWGQVVCPHTAVALSAARGLNRSEGPVVALSTAHPAKFGSVVSQVLGFEPDAPPALRGLEDRVEQYRIIDADPAAAEAAMAGLG
ncbi:threonine synthase [Brevundimonas sp.]|uniref:threonine synthase n=1 Tax=Brevundimonas sp. TaxID=1871086 RepID=UPI002ABC7F24|nr:threonine synthase [Brevundimonas sp.]MDZ4365077.1 threonine synthase [Brevundimonas sp.]